MSRSKGYQLVCEGNDRPGLVGEVGTLMFEFGRHISRIDCSQRDDGTFIMVVGLDRTLTATHLTRVREIPGILGVKLARL